MKLDFFIVPTYLPEANNIKGIATLAPVCSHEAQSAYVQGRDPRKLIAA